MERNSLFKIICCLLLAAVALLCEADAKEGECKVIFGTPYKEKSDIEHGLRALVITHNFYEFVLPYKSIHKEVVPKEYSYRTKEKMYRRNTDKDKIDRDLKEWAEEKKKAIQEEVANCTCSQ